jgi:hypothetical protein
LFPDFYGRPYARWVNEAAKIQQENDLPKSIEFILGLQTTFLENQILQPSVYVQYKSFGAVNFWVISAFLQGKYCKLG